MPTRTPDARRAQGSLFARLWRDYLRRYWPRMTLASLLMVVEASAKAAERS